jgi:hypothetical protein
MSIGGEWFVMWMPPKWNGVPDIFRFLRDDPDGADLSRPAGSRRRPMSWTGSGAEST